MAKIVVAAQVFPVNGGVRIRYTNKKGQMIMTGTMSQQLAYEFIHILGF